MSDKNDNNGEKVNQNYYLNIGFGIAFGAAFGVLYDKIAIGAGLGMPLGIGKVAIMDKNTNYSKIDVIKVVLVHLK